MSLSRLSAVVRDIRYVNLKLKMKVVPKITLKNKLSEFFFFELRF